MFKNLWSILVPRVFLSLWFSNFSYPFCTVLGSLSKRTLESLLTRNTYNSSKSGLDSPWGRLVGIQGRRRRENSGNIDRDCSYDPRTRNTVDEYSWLRYEKPHTGTPFPRPSPILCPSYSDSRRQYLDRWCKVGHDLRPQQEVRRKRLDRFNNFTSRRSRDSPVEKNENQNLT